MDFENHPLWDFTLEAHQKNGVHEACLALQTKHGIDVNFLFWCCWLGETGAAALDEIQMGRAMESVGKWQEEIVRPVWTVRRRLKPAYGSFRKDHTESLRQQLIGAELDAEHIEMLHLAQVVKFQGHMARPTGEKVRIAAHNLRIYLLKHFAKQRGKPFRSDGVEKIPENVLEPLGKILQACFPGLEKEAAKKHLLAW